MRVIGITGGVGSGKSRVLSYLQSAYGMEIFQADEAAKKLIEPDGSCFSGIVALLGKGILDETGSIDRVRMADLIFHSRALRDAVDDIIHPAVIEATEREIDAARNRGCSCFVIEAALLFESKYDEICDEVWYIYADTGTRTGRLRQERGYSADKIQSIMKAQLDDAAFRGKSTIVIDNSGAFDDTKHTIDLLLEGKDRIK